MTGSADTRAGTAGAASSSASAGAALKAAREAAGLSLDAVAQQLKLAPRQVQALEDEDFEHLPGRTFVRGFARNYARYVHLDPDTVLALLPAGEAAPALERPTLAPARRPMGELPVEGVARHSALRWLMPLLLLCIVVAAGFYEYTRQQAALRAGAGAPAPMKATPAAPAPASTHAPGQIGAPPREAMPAAAPATPPAPGTLSTPLPNPLTATPVAGNAATAPATPGPPQPPRAAASAAEDARTATAGGGTSAAVAGQAPLVLAFKGRSWVEVRDASGRVVLQSTEDAGAIRTISGTPPLQLALGNASEVDVTFRGQPVDLRPYTRGSVARISLR